jgi:hypothetical protein
VNVASWLNDTITLAARTGLAASGNPSYGTPQTGVPARVEIKTKAVVNAQGERVFASHWLMTQTEVKVEDRIQLSEESFYRRAIAVAEGKDKRGAVTHYEVWL